ncbi:hypothetical protein L0244_39360, partial [bacterium]|nr:hypothetical protein [bacterium]
MVKKILLNRTFWQQQRLSITGHADVKFSFMVFIVCALLATGLACAGTVPDRLAVAAAFSIGGHHRIRRAST